MTGPWRVQFVDLSLEDIWEPANVRRFVEEHGYIPWALCRTHADDPNNGGVHDICPLCYRLVGRVNFQGHGYGQAEWAFNGNYDRPTLSPSVLAYRDGFHCWVTDGQIIDAGTPPHG